MSAPNERPPRKRAARTRRATRTPATGSQYVAPNHSVDTAAAREHYHREKARRAGRERPADHPLEQARRAYEELLAKEAEKAKGGRPRKIVAAKSRRAEHDRHKSDNDE